jgi:hypothetical protein
LVFSRQPFGNVTNAETMVRENPLYQCGWCVFLPAAVEVIRGDDDSAAPESCGESRNDRFNALWSENRGRPVNRCRNYIIPFTGAVSGRVISSVKKAILLFAPDEKTGSALRRNDCCLFGLWGKICVRLQKLQRIDCGAVDQE